MLTLSTNFVSKVKRNGQLLVIFLHFSLDITVNRIISQKQLAGSKKDSKK